MGSPALPLSFVSATGSIGMKKRQTIRRVFGEKVPIIRFPIYGDFGSDNARQ